MRGVLVAAALVLSAGSARAEDEAPIDRTACERAEPACDPFALLSGLELKAVNRVLTADSSLVIDHAPYGKTISAIRIVPQDVFAPGDLLYFANALHSTTRDSVIRREITLDPGDVWDQLRIDEMARRLRDSSSTSLVAIVPLQAPEGQVEMLVVTRDVWSLRADTTWELQAGRLNALAIVFAEYNLLGRRRQVAVSFRMDQGAYLLGPRYVERNIAGKHIGLYAQAGPLFKRGTTEIEGSESLLELTRSLWSVDTKWGGGLTWSHKNEIERKFIGNGLKGYVCGSASCRDAIADDDPSTVDDDPSTVVPHEFRQRNLSLVTSVVRAFGDDAWQQRVTGSYEFTAQRSELLEGFPGDPVVEEGFRADVMGRKERTSTVFVGGELLEPRFRRVQNLDSYDLAEDVPTGLTANARVGTALRLIGSTANFLRLGAGASYGGALGDDGIWAISAAGSTRIERWLGIDNTLDVTIRVATPSFLLGRVVTQVQTSELFRDTQNDFLTAGGANGLRGFPINAFDGVRRAVWNTELRTRPVPLGYTRWGLVAFYDLGGTGPRYGSMKLHHDVGVGLRILVPQLQTGTFRMDFAFPLDGPDRGALRFTAGRAQAF